MEVKCTKCGRKREKLETRCKYCGAPFEMEIDFPYRENNFPYIDKWISLGEIKTPILKKENVFFKLDYTNTADRFQSGTWSVPAVYAAIEGMELIKRIDQENIDSRIMALMDHTMGYAESKGLRTITPHDSKERGAIASFLVNDPHGVEAKLRNMGTITSSRDVGLRIAPHFYNTEEEIETAIDQIWSLLEVKK